MTKPLERRRHIRCNREQNPVKLLVTELGEYDGELVDVSESGAGVIVMGSMVAAKSCMVAFDINNATSNKRINAVGTVVYVAPAQGGDSRIGIQFFDMDNYSKLLLKDWIALAFHFA
jgi:hypothetical protein